MFITDHPQIAAGIFAYDPSNEEATEYAHSIASQYAHRELTRLRRDYTASSSTALRLLEGLHPAAAVHVSDILEDMLMYYTDEYIPGWEATFASGYLDEATRTELIEPDQASLCQTWIARIEQAGIVHARGRHNAFIAEATVHDARALLALNVIALRVMGEHADEAQRGLEELSEEDIRITERLLPAHPLPGLPLLPFRDEEAARYAARWFHLADLQRLLAG